MTDIKQPKTTAEKLMAKKKRQDELGSHIEQGKDEYVKALNSIAQSPNGKIVLKTIIKATGVFEPDRSKDVSDLIRQSERKNVYLDLIRPYLDIKSRQELES